MSLFWINPQKYKQIKKSHRAPSLQKFSITKDKNIWKWFKRRISLLISFKSTAVCGGMTLEASLVLPLFIFFTMSILYSFLIIRLQTDVIVSLHQVGNAICFHEYGHTGENTEEFSGSVPFDDFQVIKENGRVIIKAAYQVKPFLFWLNPGSLEFENQYYGHAWIGYDVTAGRDIEQIDYVYIAETGTVYHFNRECSYLRLSVRSVDKNSLPDLRNQSGERYYACEICEDNKSPQCYITANGNRYHSDLTCSGIKRTIFIIPLQDAQAQGREACSKCG